MNEGDGDGMLFVTHSGLTHQRIAREGVKTERPCSMNSGPNGISPPRKA
jgi:hypothetical protein